MRAVAAEPRCPECYPYNVPDSVDITFSGITTCSGCLWWNYPSTTPRAIVSFNSNPNKVWTCSLRIITYPWYCLYELIEYNAVHVKRYSDLNCTVFLDEFDVRLMARAQVVAGKVEVKLTCFPSNGNCFVGKKTADSGCYNVSGITNLYTCGSPFIVADGGTASVVENW
jgi:hypothetical protein